MIAVPYRSDGQGFVVWGRTRDERDFPEFTGSGCIFLLVLLVGWDRSVQMWCVVDLRGNREQGLRYLLAIANRCRVIVRLGSICARPIPVVPGKGCSYDTAP